MSTLEDKASFTLGISKRTFRLLIRYLRLYEKWGAARIVFLREINGELVYWLKNSTCYYTVGINFHKNTVELRKVYFSFDLKKDVSVREVIGPADRRRTHLEMLETMVKSERSRKTRQLTLRK
jgi:hypothetical protein